MFQLIDHEEYEHPRFHVSENGSVRDLHQVLHVVLNEEMRLLANPQLQKPKASAKAVTHHLHQTEDIKE